jgi:hypothetical protein
MRVFFQLNMMTFGGVMLKIINFFLLYTSLYMVGFSPFVMNKGNKPKSEVTDMYLYKMIYGGVNNKRLYKDEIFVYFSFDERSKLLGHLYSKRSSQQQN